MTGRTPGPLGRQAKILDSTISNRGPLDGTNPHPTPPRPRVRGPQRRVWVYRGDIGTHWVHGNGWNIVMPEAFDGLLHLFRQLNEYRTAGGFLSASDSLHGRVRELGIVAHGGPDFGTVMMNPTVSASSLQSGSNARRRLRLIGEEFLTSEARVTFYSCAAAAGDAGEGSDLLRELSLVWPGRTVVGFVTYGFVSPSGSTTAGAITNTLVSLRPRLQPAQYPRFDVDGPEAKHAVDGTITRWERPVELWRLYQEHNPSGARQVIRRAQEKGVTAAREYASTVVRIDVTNPLFPSS